MKKVYISGPLTNLPNGDMLKAFYEQIGVVCSRLNMQPYIPHQHSDPILHPEISPQAIYDLDRTNVVSAELVIAYVGVPALGVGQEIEIAKQHNIPVILVYELGCSVTRMVRGNPIVAAEVVGRDFNHIVAQLEQILPNLTKASVEVESNHHIRELQRIIAGPSSTLSHIGPSAQAV
ncbi:MAG: hypothetical protein BroJett011_18190 [Chloroflexota bacterium]|nr:MAG: hypothetical protein BroJett011_18190 [Chloroflexota bacterium]